MKRSRVVAIIFVLLGTLTATACPNQGGSSGSGSGNPGGGNDSGGVSSAQASVLLYDANLCQYFETTVPLGQGAKFRFDGPYCATPVPGAHVPTFDFYARTDVAKKPVYRQVFAPGNEAYAVKYSYITGQWTRELSSGGGDIEQCWKANEQSDCEWVTIAEYTQRLNDQAQAKRISQQQAAAAKQAADAAAAANRAETQRILAELEERKMKADSIWVAPDCVWSSNGCR